MEEKEEILVEVKIDEAATEKTVADLRVTLEGLKKQAELTRKEFKEGGITSEQYAAAITKIERSSKAVGKEIQGNNRTLELAQRATKATSGSLNQMRANLSLLTEMYADLTKEERENIEVGGELQKQIRGLSDALKSTEGSIGNNTRNVGNYKDSILQLDSSFGVFGGTVEKVKGYLETTRTGLEATKVGLTGIKGAIASTGIGLLVLALGALVSWLTKTQKGMEVMAKATGAIGAVFNLFLKGVTKLGEKIYDAFDNPKQAAIELGELVKSQVVNRFTALKDILEAIIHFDLKAIGKALFQLFTGAKPESLEQAAQALTDAANAGAAVAAEEIKIRNAEREVLKARAQNRAEIEKLKKLSEDTTKTTAQRIAAAQKAYDLENKTLKQQIALAGRKIANARAEYSLATDKIPVLDKINELEIQRAELLEESYGKQTELQNTLNSLRIEGEQKAHQLTISNIENEITAQEQAKKQRIPDISNALTVADAEAALSDIAAIDEKVLQLREKLLRQQGELEAVGLKKGSAQRLAIEAATEASIAKLRLDFYTEREAAENRADTAAANTRLLRARKGSIAELEEKQKLIELQADAEANEVRRSIANAQERAYRLQEIEEKRIEAQEQLLSDYNKRFSDTVLSIAEQATSSLSQAWEAAINIQTKVLDRQQEAALKSAGTNAELRQKIEEQYAKKKEDLEKKAAEKRQKIASVENIIQGAQAATAALVDFAKNPILGTITLALVTAKTLANQALIDSQAFADGGYVSDGRGSFITGPGSSRSDSIRAKISNGESVINAVSTEKYYDQLSAINVAGGGRAFPGAGSVPSTAAVPGFTYGGVALQSNNSLVPQLVQAFRQLPAPVVAVTDFNRKRDAMQKVEVRADD